MNFAPSMFLVVVLSISSGSVATAQDFDKGLAAYQGGDFATALEEWTPLVSSSGLSLDVRSNIALGNLSDEDVRDQKISVQNYLGVMYQSGLGVLQDDIEAVRWYRQAAEQGHATAQYNLGLMFANSKSNQQDNVSAHM
jgi:TPR repeat protein